MAECPKWQMPGMLNRINPNPNAIWHSRNSPCSAFRAIPTKSKNLTEVIQKLKLENVIKQLKSRSSRNDYITSKMSNYDANNCRKIYIAVVTEFKKMPIFMLTRKK